MKPRYSKFKLCNFLTLFCLVQASLHILYWLLVIHHSFWKNVQNICINYLQVQLEPTSSWALLHKDMYRPSKYTGILQATKDIFREEGLPVFIAQDYYVLVFYSLLFMELDLCLIKETWNKESHTLHIFNLSALCSLMESTFHLGIVALWHMPLWWHLIVYESWRIVFLT